MTPTEALVMEVLAARYRTGETLWTFERRLTPTFRKLEAKGFVFWKHGIVEDTLLAGLTEAGKAEVLSPTYIPPFERTIAAAGQRLASERDDLIARGVDPADLDVPIYPEETK